MQMIMTVALAQVHDSLDEAVLSSGPHPGIPAGIPAH